MPVWEEHAYTRKDDDGNVVAFEEYERTHRNTGFARIMRFAEFKLYLICGVGFFLDAYDLFIINLVTPIWAYEYFGGLNHPPKKSPAIPLLLRGAVNASANIGNVIGQIGFGFLGDSFGRKFVYGKELIVAIIGIILIISLPNHHIFPNYRKMWYIFGMRILLGIGIGGDYPMSAAIVAERSTLQNRGKMLGWIFSNQGWGTLTASIVTLILLGCFHEPLSKGHYGKLDGVWRTQIGLALVPAFALLYFRLTMPEGKKFLQSTELTAAANSSLASSATTLPGTNGDYDDVEKKVPQPKVIGGDEISAEQERRISIVEAHAVPATRNQNMKVFFQYFSDWNHLKILIGTASTWFLLDVAFYGINLNQSVLLTDIGFAKGHNEYSTLLKTGYGNLIIAAAGYVPGYFLTIAFIEVIGRRWIQIGGFLITSLMFAILAGRYNHLHTASKFALFTIAQLFFNFGPNATTFIIPGEVFPSRVRGLAHGFSAAVGKLGAILSGVLFNYLSQPGRLGVAKVLWIFFAFNMFGAFLTFVLIPETKGVDSDDLDYKEVQAKAAGQKLNTHRGTVTGDWARMRSMF